MAQTIKLKRSATQNAVPSTSSLALGEIAINTYDGKLFIKKDVGGTESIVTIGEVGANSIGPTELASTAVTAGSYGSTSAIPVITIDADGRITSASTATISGLSANSVTSTEIAANAVGISELNVTDGTDGQVLTTDGNGTLTFEDQSGGAASATAFSTNIANGDGSTAAFTLSESPSSESKIIAFINGVFQNQDAYTISGTTITFDTAPISGTNNVVVYVIGDVYSGESVLISNFSGNGTTTAFTLANNPGNENNTQVYIDGVYQQKTTYSVSGTTLTFSSAPPTGTNNIEVVMLTSTTVNTPAAGSVVTASMADDSVTGAKLVSSAVTTAKIADANVTTAKIADANITTAKIADDAVTIGKIADAALVIESEGIGSNDNDTTLPTSAAVKDYVDTQVAGKDNTDEITEGSTNLYFTDARADARIAAADTDDLSEGSTNLYYTDARVGTYISGNRTYGNITTTGYLAGPSTFTIDPAAVGDNTGTLIIAGNLQVDGTTTTINSTTLTVDDKLVTLASGSANAGAANGAGIEVDISGATNPSILYDGTNDEWDFNKDINVTGTITASGNITGTLATAAQPNITSVGTLTALTGGTGDLNWDSGTLFVDSSANRVGIGTTAPNATLHVNGGVHFGPDSGVLNPTTGQVLIETVSGSTPTLKMYPYGASVFEVKSDGTAATIGWGSSVDREVNILNTGTGGIKVGIGTDAPAYLMHLEDSNGADLALGNSTASPSAGDYLGRIYGLDSTNNFFAGINMFYHDANDGEIRLRVKTAGTNTDVMTLVDGNVGIGTTDPNEALEVKGSIRIDNGASFTAYQVYRDNIQYGVVGGGGNQFTIQASNNKNINLFDDSGVGLTVKDGGNVGIGTSTPGAPLHVTSTNSTSIKWQRTGVSAKEWGLVSDNDQTYLYNFTDSVVSSSFHNDGRVGIGKTGPGYALDVYDVGEAWIRVDSSHTTESTANSGLRFAHGGVNHGVLYHRGSDDALLYFDNIAASTRFLIDSSGNVGIGMTSPQRKFEVSTANAEMSHFGQIAATNGHYTGITLGYREDNTNYRKAGIIQEQIGDGAARGHLHLCVDTGADNNSINPADSKLMIHGTSGNVGIGTTSPTTDFEVKNDSPSGNTTIFVHNNSASHAAMFKARGERPNANSDVSQFLTDNSGKTICNIRGVTDTASTSGRLEFWTAASSSNAVVRMTIDDAGNVVQGNSGNHSWTAINNTLFSAGGIGVTSNSDWGLQMAGSTGERIRFFSSAGGSTTVGNISVDTTGTTYNTTSDRRLKKDIKTITDGTDKLMAMNPVTHGWKADPEADTVHGFIAQEMLDIVPEAVSGDPEGEEMMAMDYGRITPVIVAALQEANKKIMELENRINELENK